MRWSSLLLRALLSLSLVLNGVATAHAAARMAFGPRGAEPVATMPQTASAATGMPCHGDRMSGDDATHATPMTSAHAAGTSSPGLPHPPHDCCGSAHCDGACALHAPLALPTAFMATLPQGAHHPGVRRLSLAYAPPALADPIRPPIA